MLNNICAAAVAAILAVLALPSDGSAYGAAHVGYTHVGPNGVYHTGETAYRGPGGVYAGGRTGAYGYGGAEYRGGYGYRYTPSYGGASGGAYRYGYIR
jgi:hypothetical protein